MSKQLLRLIESAIDSEISLYLSEARGVAARETGQLLVDNDGTEYEIANIRKFPGESDSFDSSEELSDAVDSFLELNTEEIDVELIEVNSITADKKGAILIYLLNKEDNTYRGYIRYVQNTKNGGYGKWTMAKFARDTGLKLKKGAAALEGFALKPSDLIQDENLRTVAEVVSTAKTNTALMVKSGGLPAEAGEHVEMLLDAALKGGQSPVLPGGNKYAKAYNKYLGEILAPISVVSNWVSTGDRASSEKILLPQSSYAQCRIRFFQSATNALVDSELEAPNGMKVGISSKAGTGAAASVTSLLSILNEIQSKNPKGYQHILSEYGFPISIIQTINNNNAILGVLESAKIMGIVDDQDMKVVVNMRRMRRDKAVQGMKANHPSLSTPNLIELSKQMWGKTPWEIIDPPPTYHPFFHLLAGIAKRLTAQINREDSFDAAVRAILNHSSVIQVNSKMGRVNKVDAFFKDFNVVYPPNFQGKIYANSGKNFFTTGIKGKISFKIKTKVG